MAEFDIINSKIPAGLSVIEASAGTGKTYALSHLVPRLLLDGSVASIGQILLVTFTNDAARELSDRTRKVLETLHDAEHAEELKNAPGVHRLRQEFPAEKRAGIIAKALLEIDQLRVSTIHSFCQQALQTEGALCGLPVMPELVASTDEIAEQALHDIWEKEVAASPLASAIAIAQDWIFDDDLKVLKKFLPSHETAPVPPVGDLAAGANQLAGLPARFTRAVCDEVRSIQNRVTDWMKDCTPDETGLAGLVDLLEQAPDALAPGFFRAVSEIASLPGWIKKKNKEALQAAESCAAVKISIEACDLIKKLRWSFRIQCLGQIHQAVEDALKNSRQISYDGLIAHLHYALIKGPNKEQLARRLRERHKVALIDESQDTDPRQFGIFSAIFLDGDHRLVLIGDPKQAIYGFRGADVNTYLDAKDQSQEIFDLTKTFRAPASLVDATNALFVRPGSLLKEGLAFHKASSGKAGDRILKIAGADQASRIEFWIAPDDSADLYSSKSKRNARISAETASEIVRILESGQLISGDKDGLESAPPENVRPGHCAVLVSDSYQAEAIEKALKDRNVPAVRAGSDDVMVSEEAADLLSILKALDDPRRKGLRFAALATRLLGRSDADLRALAGSEEAMLPEFLRWEQAALKYGPAAALALIDREEEIVVRLATGGDGDRRITNLRQLSDILQAAYLEHGNHAGKLLRWFEGEIIRAKDRSDIEERQLQLESDAEAVRIVTMHKAKGMEYPLVFCPFLWDSRDPKDQEKLSRRGEPDALIDTQLAATEPDDNGATAKDRFLDELTKRLQETEPGIEKKTITAVLKNASASRIEAALARASLEERLRLAYVAITRAQVRAWVHAGELCSSRNMIAASALDWLLRTDHLDDANFSEPDFELWRLKAATSGRGARHQQGLELLIHSAAAQGLISWKTPPAPANAGWNPNNPAAAPGGIIPLTAPNVPDPWYLTSFSSLTKEKDPHWEPDADAQPSDQGAQTENALPPNPFLNAAGGKVVGTAIHDWIEQWDFREPDANAVKKHLAGYAIPKLKEEPVQPPFDEAVTGMLRILRGATLPGFDCTIAEACPEPKASEWHFHLPIRKDAPLSPQSLARIFEQHPQTGYEGYHARLAELNADGLRGFLHGFIDRLAVHPQTGQWGVIDWKTNNLGTSPAAYGLPSLQKCAMDHHYFLQAHLYLVALRRYLGGADKIQGAWLVFLRGASAGTGVLSIQPPGPLLAALDDLFFKP
ncbi:MAG: UvrD-helicase domain-containing protein [Verrucomicrobiota bacterium]